MSPRQPRRREPSSSIGAAVSGTAARGLGGFGSTFRFLFVTIEDVVLLDERTLGVLNDHNFPFSSGRTPGLPDNDEFITIRLTRPLT